MTTPLEVLIASGRDVCRIEEVAQVLDMSRATAYRYAQSGDLPGLRKLGTSYRVSIAELARWAGVDPPPTRDDPGGQAEVVRVETSGGAPARSTS